MSMLYLPYKHPLVEKLKNRGIEISDTVPEAKVRRIGILNLMPQKQEAEEEYYVAMSGSGVDIQIVLAKMSGLRYKTTPQEYMDSFYVDIAQIMNSNQKYDGFIVTGAPLEQYDYEEVRYWRQLHDVYRWSLNNVRSTLNICWGAFASLKIFFNINKYWTEQKMFGLYLHHQCGVDVPLLSGMPQEIMIPISRQITFKREEIEREHILDLLLDQEVTGPELAIAWGGRQIFANGHLEYADGRLKFEYERDRSKGLDIEVPKNYFKDDNPALGINSCWHENGDRFYHNWLNEYVCNDGLRIEPVQIDFKA